MNQENIGERSNYRMKVMAIKPLQSMILKYVEIQDLL